MLAQQQRRFARSPTVVTPSTRVRHRRTLPVSSAALQQLPGGTWWAPARGKPQGICHFVGGAFAGAAPQVVYDLFLQLLSDEGYTVIATPYAITFKHADCALQIKQSFTEALNRLRRSQAAAVPGDVPVYGVGHSNGALVHLLIGSLTESPSDANIIISYNNKQVSDAIPIPGFLEGLGPAVQLSRNAPPPPPPLQPLDWSQFSQSFVQRAAASVPSQIIDRRLVVAAAPAIEQFGGVVTEVGDGVTDFIPSPSESRRLIADGYTVADTLLVKFAVDDIDQTEEMAAILMGKYPGSVEKTVLPGSHLTPCGSSVQWEVGPVFGPQDAVLQLIKSRAQADVRRLVRQMVVWMRAHKAAVDHAHNQAMETHDRMVAAVADSSLNGMTPSDLEDIDAVAESLPVPVAVGSRY